MSEEEAEKLKGEIRTEMSEHFQRLKAEIDDLTEQLEITRQKLKDIGAEPMIYGNDFGYVAETEAKSIAERMRHDEQFENGTINQTPQV